MKKNRYKKPVVALILALTVGFGYMYNYFSHASGGVVTPVIISFASNKTKYLASEPIVLSWSSQNAPNQSCVLSEFLGNQSNSVVKVNVADNASNYALQFQYNSFTDSEPPHESHSNDPGIHRLQLGCGKATATVTVSVASNTAKSPTITSFTSTKATYTLTEPIIVSWSSQGVTMCGLSAYGSEQAGAYTAPKVRASAINYALDFENNGQTGSVPGTMFHNNSIGTHRIRLDCGDATSVLSVNVSNEVEFHPNSTRPVTSSGSSDTKSISNNVSSANNNTMVGAGTAIGVGTAGSTNSATGHMNWLDRLTSFLKSIFGIR